MAYHGLFHGFGGLLAQAALGRRRARPVALNSAIRAITG
jgi:hypothetical protein